MDWMTKLPGTINVADYWEAQAEMWQENYKDAESEAKRYKDALLKIYEENERIRNIVLKALGEEE